MIRAFTPSDVTELKRIHSLHFRDEFDLPDLMKYICAFSIEDDYGKIITAGGVRSIAECVVVTDLSLDPRVRIKALYQMLEAATFVCRRSGYDQMYVWSRDPKYSRRLVKNGFRSHEGQSLILDL
jgi:hypothetical protein